MMRRRVRCACAVLLCVTGALPACSVKRVPNRDPASSPERRETPPPYDFEAERQTPPPPAVAPEPATAAPDAADQPLAVPPVDLGSPAVAVQDLPSAVRPPAPAASTPTAATTGYRVQIFASTDRAAAERVQYEVESRLGHRAYVESQPPYFKVRVGNCRRSEDCRDLQESLRRAGYESIWIVESTIEP